MTGSSTNGRRWNPRSIPPCRRPLVSLTLRREARSANLGAFGLNRHWDGYFAHAALYVPSRCWATRASWLKRSVAASMVGLTGAHMCLTTVLAAWTREIDIRL